MESELLGRVLPDLFGYHIIQLGNHYDDRVITPSRISHQVVLETGGTVTAGSSMLCRGDALPIESDTIDVLVISHILEFSQDPHGVLREAERILIGEGRIVVLGFNPWSLYGLWRLVLGWRGVAPWCGKFFSLARVKDWLGLLGFEIESVAKAAFRPPVSGARINQRLAFLEQLGAYCWPCFGNIYLVVAKKRVLGMTPLKSTWKSRRRLVAGSVVEPTRRSGQSNGKG